MINVSTLIFRDRHKRLLLLVQEHWFRLLAAMACMLVVAASTAASAYLVKPVLDDIFFSKNIQMLKFIPAVVIFIYFLRGFGQYGQEYLMNYVGQSIIKRLRDSLYVHIQDLPISFFQKERTGALMSRITNDVNILKSMVSTAFTTALRDCFTIIGLTGVIFYRDWKLALYALIILPLAFYPIVEFGRRVRRVSTGCQEAMADLNSFLHETFLGNKIIKAFGMEDYEKKRFFEKTEGLFGLEMKAVVARALSSPVMEFLGGLGIAFIIWYGGYRVITGTSTPGTFFSFMAAVLMLYDPIKKLSGLNNSIQEGLAAADRIFDIIERDSDIVEDPDAPEIPPGPHSVTFQSVFFGYETEPVLTDINLEVKSGEILAIVGMSGGGKTTLVNLLPRFFDVTQGAILIDGFDIRKIQLASLRRQIAIVTQESILFNESVRDNIAYGRPGASEAAIREAAEAAYAHDFISRLPQGYATRIGELGARLSGGEKQRICIARALLKDAPILILDEATSSLDTESEMLVQKAIENLMRGRTTFVIAHRLSTIGYAHRILVIADGRIVEEGNHESLMTLNGEYFKLYQMQFSGNGDGPAGHAAATPPPDPRTGRTPDKGRKQVERMKAAGGSWAVLVFFAAAGAALLVFPQIDLGVSALFFDPVKHFFLKDRLICRLIYHSVEVFAVSLAVGLPLLFLFIQVKKRPIFTLNRKKIVYLLLVLALGPGVIVNVVFKDNWGRARPDQIAQFGGEKRFTPAWVLSDQCRQNCAFVSGHASMGFYLFAFAFLFPKHRKKWTGAAVTGGGIVGLVRIAQGGHFLSDVVFSGMILYLTAWFLGWLMAPAGRVPLGEAAVPERP